MDSPEDTVIVWGIYLVKGNGQTPPILSPPGERPNPEPEDHVHAVPDPVDQHSISAPHASGTAKCIGCVPEKRIAETNGHTIWIHRVLAVQPVPVH
jgi:hypothetical protein